MTAPVEVRACKIPTEAEEDCSTAVSTAPASTPRDRVFEAYKQVHEPGLIGQRKLMAVDMVFIPAIRTEKPIMILPTPLLRFILAQHIKEDADKAKDGGPRIGVQHLDGEGITLQA